MAWNPNSVDGLSYSEVPEWHFLSSFEPRNERGTSKLAIEDLDIIIFDKDFLAKYKDQECFCAGPWKLEQEARKLPCKHIFHSECIIKWLEQHNTCPTCRHELPTLDEGYEFQKRHPLDDDDKYSPSSLPSQMYL
eukprot:TRINITY_DN6507_c0_g1_i2.p1 TRINITY_DN6507_c0_g1~~TRINITY_DN6507_c0_g1_i2.p1  ORF type:complete len:135 (-),score=8.82 TRINITY_DN6507_c0_g1_i2:58-462(-)